MADKNYYELKKATNAEFDKYLNIKKQYFSFIFSSERTME